MLGPARLRLPSHFQRLNLHTISRQRRTLIAAPGPQDGPLLERRSDRDLPTIEKPYRRWVRTAPIFLAILTASMLGIFNYQKSSSSVVTSTMYALRTSPAAREVLGDEIYFAHSIPWIWGEMNQLHGRINIRYAVKGTKGRGEMRFKSTRHGRMGKFTTEEWTLETKDGRLIQLLESAGSDPFQKNAA